MTVAESRVLIQFLLLCVGGCTLALRAQRPEPATVAIHNTPGEHLQQVILKAARVKPVESVWLGSVSPAPMGTTQQIGRRTDPRPVGVGEHESQWPGRTSPTDLPVSQAGSVVLSLNMG